MHALKNQDRGSHLLRLLSDEVSTPALSQDSCQDALLLQSRHQERQFVKDWTFFLWKLMIMTTLVLELNV